MATEYISREVAICEILSEPTDAHYPSWYAEKLKQISAADVQPVVRGKWIRGNESRTSPTKDSYICSVCGEKTLSGFCGNPAKTNFCPNCGADMREAKTDD